LSSDDRQSIAREYAEALFQLATAQGLASEVVQELGDVVSLVRSDKNFAVFLTTPAISREKRMKSISNVFSGKVSELFYDFLMVAARRGRLDLLEDVFECYRSLDDESSGRIRGTLTTSVTMEVSEQIRVQEQISRAMHKTVLITPHVDSEIIGGMVLTVGGVVMDGSVRRRLERVSERMKRRGATLRVTGE
jgi:F-type H+-transporting ATPase subunit delta